MGRSTVAQLIQRAKTLNEYNNSGVASDAVWLDHFNSALVEMVDDLNLKQIFLIQYSKAVAAYPLPDDYYSLVVMNDANSNERINQRRSYDERYHPGYWIMDKGDYFEIDIVFHQDTTFNLLYQRYPKILEHSLMQSQKPEVPTAGETALCYKAISNALKNNNQLGQAAYYDGLYKEQLAIIRTAVNRARGE